MSDRPELLRERTGGSDQLYEGQRVGRYVIMRDRDGCIYALSAGAVGALCETDEGALLMLSGGRMLHVPRPMTTVLAWLDGRAITGLA